MAVKLVEEGPAGPVRRAAEWSPSFAEDGLYLQAAVARHREAFELIGAPRTLGSARTTRTSSRRASPASTISRRSTWRSALWPRRRWSSRTRPRSSRRWWTSAGCDDRAEAHASSGRHRPREVVVDVLRDGDPRAAEERLFASAPPNATGNPLFGPSRRKPSRTAHVVVDDSGSKHQPLGAGQHRRKEDVAIRARPYAPSGGRAIVQGRGRRTQRAFLSTHFPRPQRHRCVAPRTLKILRVRWSNGKLTPRLRAMLKIEEIALKASRILQSLTCACRQQFSGLKGSART